VVRLDSIPINTCKGCVHMHGITATQQHNTVAYTPRYHRRIHGRPIEVYKPTVLKTMADCVLACAHYDF